MFNFEPIYKYIDKLKEQGGLLYWSWIVVIGLGFAVGIKAQSVRLIFAVGTVWILTAYPVYWYEKWLKKKKDNKTK